MALYYLGIHFRKAPLLGHILESSLLRFPSHMKTQAQDPSVEWYITPDCNYSKWCKIKLIVITVCDVSPCQNLVSLRHWLHHPLEHERYFKLSLHPCWHSSSRKFASQHVLSHLISLDFGLYSEHIFFLAGYMPPKILCLHWRWVWGLVVMATVVDLLVSTEPFCLPRSSLTYLYV